MLTKKELQEEIDTLNEKLKNTIGYIEAGDEALDFWTDRVRELQDELSILKLEHARVRFHYDEMTDKLIRYGKLNRIMNSHDAGKEED